MPTQRKQESPKDERVEVVEMGHGAEHGKHDVVSDPARNDQMGGDWSTEGGATPVGPATHTEKD